MRRARTCKSFSFAIEYDGYKNMEWKYYWNGMME